MNDEIKSKIVCMLTQYFYPDLPGTAKIAKDIALGLSKSGFIVKVYTGSPAYSSVKDTSEQTFDKNIEVHRAYSPNLSRSGNLSRLINAFLVSLSLSSKLFFKKHHAMIVDSTSPFLLTMTFFVSLLKKTPYIVIVHDVYPDIAIKLGVVSGNSPLALIWKNIYKMVYKRSSRIVVLGSSMKRIVAKNLNESTSDKLVIIPNWADASIKKPSVNEKMQFKKKLGFEDSFVVIYSGNMGLTHDMDTILKSAERFIDIANIQYLLIGGGGKFNSVVEFVSKNKLNNVKILSYQPEDVFPEYLACADVSLVSLTLGMEGLSVPSKIYSSLAAGLPIIGILNESSEIATILNEGKCGYISTPGDVDMLVDTINILYSDSSKIEKMGVNARSEFENKYSTNVGVSAHIDLLNKVLNENNE